VTLKQTDLSRADLNLLVLFQVVLEERHVGRAAARLNLTPSAVSHGLGRLRRLLSDPLFLRTPKGVVPTQRATALAVPVADVLARVGSVIAGAQPFDPATSARRFAIGMPDAAAAVVLPPLLADLRRTAPGVAIAVRQLLPPPGALSNERAWEPVLGELDSAALDVAVVPLAQVPVRFVEAVLFDEDFVVAMRAGHPFAKSPTLERYCAMQHLLVSMSGDTHGMIDQALAAQDRSRHVVLTAPTFMQALALLAETDLIAALPRHLVAMQGARFGLTSAELPPAIRRGKDSMRAVATKAAMNDAGVAWLFAAVRRALAGRLARRRRRA
jgi:DNA-binding transcriptional LysR family regulator